MPYDTSLIIISGLPRSGTSWLGKIFDSHPGVLYRHEPDTVIPMKWLPLVVENNYGDYQAHLRGFVTQLPDIRDPKVSASLPFFFKSYMQPARNVLVSHFLRFVKMVALSGVPVRVPRFSLPPKNRDYVLTWKTIESSGRLGFFAETLDRARIVHILRHPGGVIASCLRGYALNKFNGYDLAEDDEFFDLWCNSAAGLSHGLSLAQFKAMSPVERHAWLCVLPMQQTLKDIEGRKNCRVVLYEELCARPAAVTRQLLDFCGLDFDSQTRRFLAASTSKTDNRYFSVFKDSAISAKKWKTELDAKAQQEIKNVLNQSNLADLWR